MFKVEYAGTSIDHKLNHAWKCSSIKIRHRASIFQLKARVETHNIRTKSNFKIKEKTNLGTAGHV